jgi:hypothetical protein
VFGYARFWFEFGGHNIPRFLFDSLILSSTKHYPVIRDRILLLPLPDSEVNPGSTSKKPKEPVHRYISE